MSSTHTHAHIVTLDTTRNFTAAIVRRARLCAWCPPLSPLHLPPPPPPRVPTRIIINYVNGSGRVAHKRLCTVGACLRASVRMRAFMSHYLRHRNLFAQGNYAFAYMQAAYNRTYAHAHVRARARAVAARIHAECHGEGRRRGRWCIMHNRTAEIVRAYFVYC